MTDCGSAFQSSAGANTLVSRSVGALTFWMVENCNRLTVDLAGVLPPEDSPDYLMMVLQITGEVRIVKRNQTNIIRPGTLGLYRFSRGCDELYADDGARQLVGIVPRQELTGRTPGIMDVLQRQLPGDSPVSSLAFNFLAGLYENAHHLGMVRHDMSDVAINLLQAALAEQIIGLGGYSYHDKIRARVKRYVDNHIRDASLSVASIAEAMRCSTRHLQTVFERSEPLSRYIWRVRLERCAAALRAPCHTDQSITEIAFLYGFSNASHFSRAFKTHFGMPPKAYRTQAWQ